MIQLTVDEKEIRELYKKANRDLKILLENKFGKEFFETIQDRVKTYEDACFELGIDPTKLPNFKEINDQVRVSVIAYYKLTIIARALNEGWNPDYKDFKQGWHIPVFHINDNKTGICFLNTNFISVIDVTTFHLCCKTKELAEYFGRQFIDIWTDYLLI